MEKIECQKHDPQAGLHQQSPQSPVLSRRPLVVGSRDSHEQLANKQSMNGVSAPDNSQNANSNPFSRGANAGGFKMPFSQPALPNLELTGYNRPSSQGGFMYLPNSTMVSISFHFFQPP